MGVRTGTDLLAVPGWRRRLVQLRMLATIAAAKRLTRQRSAFTRELVLEGGDICNPSVAVLDGRVLVAVRRPSYRLVGTRLRLAPRSGLDSTTLLMTLDHDLRPVATVPVDTGDVSDRIAAARDGLEDPRLFTVRGRLLCLWSGLHLGTKGPTREHEGLDWDTDWSETTNTMVLAELHDAVAVEARAVPSPAGRPREKNWMPLSQHGEIEFAYYLADGAYLELPDEADGGQPRFSTKAPSSRRIAGLLQGWSGSSQLIPWGEGGRLCVVHLALRGIPVLSRTRPAVYLHRFVALAPDGRVTAVSRPFVFRELGVEFCAGAAVEGADLLLSFGVDDSRAFVTRVAASRVRSLLKPVG